MVQGRIHLSKERYSGRYKDIIPLSGEGGVRQYVNMHPYVLEPELFMTVGLYQKPKQYADQDEAIGEVLSAQQKSMRQHQAGNAQAWYYPQDRIIVLWECFVDPFIRGTQPIAESEYMKKFWQTFETWLIEQFPKAERIVTPFNDPIAESIEDYQTFLRSLGYQPAEKAVFSKPL
jgi:hypothetical protein